MDHITVDDLRIAFRSAGEGRPLVLLHGGLSDSREWRAQIESLSDDFFVVAWDAPGCGGSSDPPETFRLGDYADCLAGFIEALELERPHIAGLSFGAGLALALYESHPSIPASLALASAYAGWAGSLPAGDVRARLNGVLRDIEKPGSELVERFLPTLFAGKVSGRTVDEISAIMADFHPAGARTMVRSFAEADLRYVLPRVEVPTLLVYGEQDGRAPKAVADAIHAAIKGSQLVFIPDVGHQINMESPARFDAEVRAFLRAVG